MKILNKLLWSLFSGLLFWLSWYPNAFFFLIFVAFVPLFFLLNKITIEKGKTAFRHGLFYSLPAFLLWNAVTTWWIWHTTPPGAIAAICLNALFMAMVFGLWYLLSGKLPKWVSPIALIAIWCSWEFLHLHWDISWPWLNLGNVFAPVSQIIQWYEFTGTFGGTIWVLLVNWLIYTYLRDAWMYAKDLEIRKKIINKKLGFIVLAIVLPLCFSLLIYHKENIPIEQSIEALVIQQNTDPHEDQYHMSNAQHVQRLMEVAQTKITPQTQLMICSESAIPHDIPLLALFHFNDPKIELLPLMQLDTFLMQYPQLNIIAGVSTVGFYDFKPSATARNIDGDLFQEDFNSSMLMNQEGVQGVYHKSRLVPGVEIMPYPAIFGFLGKMMVNLGGRVISLGTDSCQHVFNITQNGESINIGVPICYESIYGEVFSQFVKNGANLMCVITNDGWWKSTPGHQQHFIYAKLRAIETRKTILRAANTGISAVINPMGEIVTQTKYNERTSILEKISTNSKLTFYVKHGDYLAHISLVITVLLLIYVLIRDITKKICAG